MKSARYRIALIATFLLAIAGAVLGSNTSDAATAPPQPIIPCDEEIVYGTIVVLDAEAGLFGLQGTDYEFAAEHPAVLDELDGMQVRIEVAADCSVRDLHVIGASDALTLRSTLLSPASV